MSPDQVVFVVEEYLPYENTMRWYRSSKPHGAGSWSYRKRGDGAPYYRFPIEVDTNSDKSGLPVWRHDHEPWR